MISVPCAAGNARRVLRANFKLWDISPNNQANWFAE